MCRGSMKGPEGYSELQVGVLSSGAEMSEKAHGLSALTCPDETMRFSGSELKA